MLDIGLGWEWLRNLNALVTIGGILRRLCIKTGRQKKGAPSHEHVVEWFPGGSLVVTWDPPTPHVFGPFPVEVACTDFARLQKDMRDIGEVCNATSPLQGRYPLYTRERGGLRLLCCHTKRLPLDQCPVTFTPNSVR